MEHPLPHTRLKQDVVILVRKYVRHMLRSHGRSDGEKTLSSVSESITGRSWTSNDMKDVV